MQNLGVFGGTFDPPHIGHLALARFAYAELDLDRVLFIPAGNQPHKQEKKVTSPEDRLEMLKLAIQDDPEFDVSTVEIDRGGLSYTWLTLKELHNRHPASKLYFIIGGDNVADIETWKKPEEIFKLATVAAASRPDYIFAGKFKDKIIFLHMPQVEVSSTMIRKMVGTGRAIKNLVPEAVENYIIAKKLYT